MGVKSRADRSSVLVDTLHRGTDKLKLTGHGGGPRDARASEHRERHLPAMRGALQIDQPLRVVACRRPGIARGAGSCVLVALSGQPAGRCVSSGGDEGLARRACGGSA